MHRALPLTNSYFRVPQTRALHTSTLRLHPASPSFSRVAIVMAQSTQNNCTKESMAYKCHRLSLHLLQRRSVNLPATRLNLWTDSQSGSSGLRRVGNWRQVKGPSSEALYRQTYRDHLGAMQVVKDSEKGETRYDQMLLTIYAQTM